MLCVDSACLHRLLFGYYLATGQVLTLGCGILEISLLLGLVL